MKAFNNLKVGAKLVAGFLIVAVIVLLVAFIGYQNLKSINEGMATMYFDRTIPIEELGNADAYVHDIPANVAKFVLIPR